MICILSQTFLEPTTEAVMDWLRAWNIPCVRINGADIDCDGGPAFSISREGVKASIKIDGETIEPDSIKVVWFRRWAYNNRHNRGRLFASEADQQNRFNTISSFFHLRNELQTVSDFFFSMLSSASWLGDPASSMINKLKVLKAASDFGLDVPDTLVTTDPEDLRRFAEKHGSVVTKAAGEMMMCVFDERLFMTYTAVVPEELMKRESWRGAFPSLFQERLKKKYEVRSFYLDGEFHSMAMFTQRPASTQTDFRMYSYEDPARTVPYRLPARVEESLRALMESLGLDTGSIDMVRTVDGRLVFLEVNPVGQFGMVSEPCNYFLERKVARALADRLYGTRR